MQQNIYFQKAVWEKFKDEVDKSKIINALLFEYYDGRVGPLVTHREEMAEASDSKIIKTKEDATEAIKQIFPEAKFEPLYRDEKNKRL